MAHVCHFSANDSEVYHSYITARARSKRPFLQFYRHIDISASAYLRLWDMHCSDSSECCPMKVRLNLALNGMIATLRAEWLALFFYMLYIHGHNNFRLLTAVATSGIRRSRVIEISTIEQPEVVNIPHWHMSPPELSQKMTSVEEYSTSEITACYSIANINFNLTLIHCEPKNAPLLFLQ